MTVTRNGRPCNLLLSVVEYEPLKQHDEQAFRAVDTPEEFLPTIEKLAVGSA